MAVVTVTPTSGADADNIDGTNTPGVDLVVRNGASSGVGTIQEETSNVTAAGTTRAIRYAKTTTSGANYTRLDDTANDKWAVRLRGVYFNALPASATATFLRLVTAADATGFTLTWSTAAKFTALDAAGTTIWNPTGMTALSAAVKYTVELWVDNDDTAGQLKVRCIRESDLVSMADSTLLTGLNMAAADLARLRVGAAIATGSGSIDWQVDAIDYELGATDYITSSTSHNGDAALAVTATLAATSHLTKHADAALALTGTLTSTGHTTKHADAALAIGATLTASGHVTKHADAALAISADLTAAGSTTGSPSGDAALDIDATLAADGHVTKHADADLAVAATLAATSHLTKHADADLGVTATLDATSHVTKHADAALSIDASLTATAHLTRQADAALQIGATLTASGHVTKHADAALAISATLTAAGSIPTGVPRDLTLVATNLSKRYTGRAIAGRYSVTTLAPRYTTRRLE